MPVCAKEIFYDLKNNDDVQRITICSDDIFAGVHLDPTSVYQPRANLSSADNHLPTVAIREHGSETAHEEKNDNDGWLTNSLIDVSVAGATIFALEALAAVVFKNPKLAAGALATLGSASGKVELARSTQFLIGAGSLCGGAVTARHYAYETITGKSESWLDSANHAGYGFLSVYLAGKLTNKFLK